MQGTGRQWGWALVSYGANPHVHSFFLRKHLLHSYFPRLDCSHTLLLPWAPSFKPSGMVVGLGYMMWDNTYYRCRTFLWSEPAHQSPQEPHATPFPFSLPTTTRELHICGHQQKAVVSLINTNSSSPEDNKKTVI